MSMTTTQEKKRAASKRWRDANREYLREYNRQWRKKHYAENKEQLLAKSKAWKKQGGDMPIYVYRCPNGHEAEEIVSMADGDKPMPCVECNEKDGSVVEMKRVPTTCSGKVLGGTPKFHPGRLGK